MKVIHLFLLLIGLTDGFAPVKPSAAHKPKLFTSSAACSTPASSIIHKSTTQLSALPLLTEESSQKLVLLTFEKAIEAGVPALFFVVGALLVVKAVKGDDSECSFVTSRIIFYVSMLFNNSIATLNLCV